MYRGIDQSFGEQIGHLTVSKADPAVRDGLFFKRVETEVEGRDTCQVFPIYGRVDFIDTFGLPPFNEWAMGVDDFKEIDVSAKVQETKMKESYKCRVKMENLGSIKLDRKLNGSRETYNAEEILLPLNNASVGVFNIEHTEGNLSMIIEREVVTERSDIEELSSILPEEPGRYLKNIRREEGLPDMVIAKQIRINGSTPAVKRKMYPFWDKKEFDQEIWVIEIGFFKYGQNETEFDEKHGRWYKLFSFEDFDYKDIEIREGNWKSERIKIGGEEKRFMSNYEKYLYDVS